MDVALWDVDPEDWKDRNKKTIVDRVMSQAGDGRTILIHDIYRTSGDAADEIMKKLTDQSYQLTTVSQLEEVKKQREANQQEKAARYDGKSPYYNDCAFSGSTKKSSNLVNASNQVIGVVELKFSSTCKTAWAKITMNNTLTSGFEANAEITRNTDGKRYNCDSTDSLFSI